MARVRRPLDPFEKELRERLARRSGWYRREWGAFLGSLRRYRDDRWLNPGEREWRDIAIALAYAPGHGGARSHPGAQPGHTVLASD